MRAKLKTKRENFKNTERRSLLFLGVLLLLYPFLKFLGFQIPRKPQKVELNNKIGTSGVHTAQDIIIFDKEGKSWAVSRKCTHLGCKVSFHEVGGYLECPCHQSRFAYDGKVLHGPAKKDLTLYEVEKNDRPPYYVVTV